MKTLRLLGILVSILSVTKIGFTNTRNNTLAHHSLFYSETIQQIASLSEPIVEFLARPPTSPNIYQEINVSFYHALKETAPKNSYLVFNTQSGSSEFFFINFDAREVTHFYIDRPTELGTPTKGHLEMNGLMIDSHELSMELVDQILNFENGLAINPNSDLSPLPVEAGGESSIQRDRSTQEYFYSNSMGQYIQRKPLKSTDVGVKEAANALGIKLWWDDEGYLANISYHDTVRLFNRLGLQLMSPLDFWGVLGDAFQANDLKFVSELLTKKYAEWLDVLYFKEGDQYFMIEHPVIAENGQWDREADAERIQEIDPPRGRYAWFHIPDLNDIFDVIDKKTGFPKAANVHQERGNHTYTFKYWDIFTGLISKTELTAIRGRVTSSDSPSMDYGMPPFVDDAKKIMIRPCRKTLLAPPIDAKVFQVINQITHDYDASMKEKDYGEFYTENKHKIIELIGELEAELIEKLKTSQENSHIKVREKFADILGFLKLYAEINDPDSIVEIENANRHFFSTDQVVVNFDGFKEFIVSSQNRLENAMDPVHPRPIVFVMGHKNPDTDAVVSSLMEAYRNHLLNPDVTYIPIVQNPTLPDEIALLLDDVELSSGILLTDKRGDRELYDQAFQSGQANWILTDHNVSERQKFVISILDHHKASEAALKQDVAKTIEISGSTSAMVVQRFYGLGMEMDPNMAEIAYGATLMDTENRTPKKMTLKDELAMDNLQRLAAGKSDLFSRFWEYVQKQMTVLLRGIGKKIDDKSHSSEKFKKLMSALLNTDNPYNLFNRDYKEDWGFGFSVAKMKNVFQDEGVFTDKVSVLEEMVDLAKQNNKQKNLPVTLVKVVDYETDNETVQKERMYFEFSPHIPEHVKRSIMDLFEVILKNEFENLPLSINRKDNFVEWSGVGLQLSRKKVAPILEPVVNAYNEYF